MPMLRLAARTPAKRVRAWPKADVPLSSDIRRFADIRVAKAATSRLCGAYGQQGARSLRGGRPVGRFRAFLTETTRSVTRPRSTCRAQRQSSTYRSTGYVTTRRILRSATPLDLVVIFLLGGFAMPSTRDKETGLLRFHRSVTSPLSLAPIVERYRAMRRLPLGVLYRATSLTSSCRPPSSAKWISSPLAALERNAGVVAR